MRNIRDICIVGAGAAGIAAAKQLRECLKGSARIRVYERNKTVGGTWISDQHQLGDNSSYYGSPQTSDTQVPSSTSYDYRVTPYTVTSSSSAIYESLRTNLPKELMAFSELDFEDTVPRFPHHTQVQRYLVQYSQKFSVFDMISFGTTVHSISKDEDSSNDRKWKVISKSEEKEGLEEDFFDAVIICNGHYYKPYIPQIPGLSEFSGLVMHVHRYRQPNHFKGQRVLVVGGGSSGIDISREINTGASKTFISLKDPKATGDIGETIDSLGLTAPTCARANFVTKRPEISRITQDAVEYIDGTTDLDIDAIVLATGYLYDFPFLFLGNEKASAELLEDGGMGTRNLFEHVFFIDDPSLAFIGLPLKVDPFPLFELQAQWIGKVFTEEVSLPDKDSMRKWQEDDQNLHFHRPKDRMILGPRQYEYWDRILKRLDMPPTSQDRRQLKQMVAELRKEALGY